MGTGGLMPQSISMGMTRDTGSNREPSPSLHPTEAGKLPPTRLPALKPRQPHPPDLRTVPIFLTTTRSITRRTPTTPITILPTIIIRTIITTRTIITIITTLTIHTIVPHPTRDTAGPRMVDNCRKWGFLRKRFRRIFLVQTLGVTFPQTFFHLLRGDIGQVHMVGQDPGRRRQIGRVRPGVGLPEAGAFQ